MNSSETATAPLLRLRGLRRIVAASAAALLLLAAAPRPAVAADDSLILISATSMDRATVERTYTLTVVNSGAAAIATTLADTAPADATVTRFRADRGRYQTFLRTWYLRNLRAGGSATLTVWAR